MVTRVCSSCGHQLEAHSEAPSLLTCPDCRTAHVPDGTTSISILTRTQVGETRRIADIGLSPDFQARYRLRRLLGAGAMGSVFLATQVSTDRAVAIKFLIRPDNPELLARFLAEGQLMARLSHPNVVRVFDTGEIEGHPYQVTEYVSGGTLADHLQRSGKLDSAEAVRLISGCLAGLGACHEAGIIHRDLKPENILLSETGDPKVADLGIAKCVETGAGLTRTGALLGTPRYMAPEQLKGEPVTPASDLYSAALILYRMLSGHHPFQADTLAELVTQHLTVEPAPVRQHAPEVPDALAKLVNRALAKSPRERPPSASRFAEQLAEAMSRRPRRGPSVVSVEPARSRADPVTTSPRRSPGVIAVAVTGAVALVVAVVWAVWWTAGRPSAAVPATFPTPAPDTATGVELFSDWVRRWGVIEGVGVVSPEVQRGRCGTYRIKRSRVPQGRSEVQEVELIDGRGRRGCAGVGDEGLSPLLIKKSDENSPCRIAYRRDSLGRLVGETAFDSAGTVVWRARYPWPDVVQYVDERGLPRARCGSGASRVNLTCSPEGFVVEARYSDAAGGPRTDVTGAFGRRFQVDHLGRVTRTTFLDEKGKVTTQANVYAREDRTYGSPWGLTEEATFDAGDKLTLSRRGSARRTYEYDSRGNMCRVSVFGVDGNPIMCKGGFASFRIRYSERGYPIEDGFFGVDGKPTVSTAGIASTGYREDERGNIVEISSFGADGKPIQAKPGHARLTAGYDDRGNEIEGAYFGIDGKPIAGKEGSHRATYGYDPQDRLIESAHFDVDGKPVLIKDGYCRARFGYDDQGRRIEERYLDSEGRPVDHRDRGYSRAARTFDGFDLVVDEKLFLADGRRTYRHPVVGEVSPSSESFKAGLRSGDVVLGCDGQEISSADTLTAITGGSTSPRRLRICRWGKSVDVAVTVVDAPLRDTTTPDCAPSR